MVHGLDQAIRRMYAEAGNQRRYTALRNDLAVAFMDQCANKSGAISPRLTASFKRMLYKKQKEWVFDVKNPNAIEAGTMVPEVRRLGALAIMNRALKQTENKATGMGNYFLSKSGKAAGFDVSSG